MAISATVPTDMASVDPTVQQALALAGTLEDRDDLEGAVNDLASAGRGALEAAQAALVRRVYARSDDFAATTALNLVNRALAKVGWQHPYSWKHRRKP